MSVDPPPPDYVCDHLSREAYQHPATDDTVGVVPGRGNTWGRWRRKIAPDNRTQSVMPPPDARNTQRVWCKLPKPSKASETGSTRTQVDYARLGYATRTVPFTLCGANAQYPERLPRRLTPIRVRHILSRHQTQTLTVCGRTGVALERLAHQVDFVDWKHPVEGRLVGGSASDAGALMRR